MTKTIALSFVFGLFLRINTALDRCDVANCICEVIVEPKYSPLVTEIFFEEGSANISKRVEQQLRQWKGPAAVVATTDGCGSIQNNQALANKRAAAVIRILPAQAWPLGQTTTKHNPLHRRSLVVNPESKWLLLLATNPADYYILDASSSMGPYWNEFTQFPFPKDSIVYIAKTMDCRNGQLLQQVKPGGYTEIWYPLWYVLNLANSHTTIMLISDMKSSVPLSPQAKTLIENKAKAKDITIKYIVY